MTYTVYDIGSNSVKILVAWVAQAGAPFEILAEESKTTRLAEDLIHTGALKAEAVERTLATLAKLREKAKALGATSAHSRAVATSAVRDSKNGKEFAREAGAVLGVPLEIFSGDDEAAGVYRGICSNPDLAAAQLLGIDVGGGSTEWIAGDRGRLTDRVSLPLGCVRLREQFIPRYPLPEAQLDFFFGTLREQLAPVLAPFRERPATAVIATGGTASAGAAIDLHLKQFSVAEIEGHRLDRNALQKIIRALAAMTVSELEAVPGLPRKRADIIVPGLAVLLVSLDLLNQPVLTVSVRGLRYGVLSEMIGGKK